MGVTGWGRGDDARLNASVAAEGDTTFAAALFGDPMVVWWGQGSQPKGQTKHTHTTTNKQTYKRWIQLLPSLKYKQLSPI